MKKPNQQITIHDLLKKAFPPEVVFLDDNPDLAINFWDIHKIYSKQDASTVLRAFLLGEIKAINHSAKHVASTTFSALPAEIGLPNYIEGTFPMDFEGDIEFGDIPADVSKFGKFSFRSRKLWSFELHNHTKADSLDIAENETATLSLDFRRVGGITIPKQLFIYIKNDERLGLVLSAECEGRFYRGMNNTMLNLVNQFMSLNVGVVDRQHHYTITEEFYGIIVENLVGSVSFPEVPSKYEQFMRGAQQYIHKYFEQLAFNKEDIDELLESEEYQQPKIQAAPKQEEVGSENWTRS